MGKSPATDKAQRELGTQDLTKAEARLSSSMMDERAIKLRRVMPDRRHTRGQDFLICLVLCLFITMCGMSLTFYRHVSAGEAERIKLEKRLDHIEKHEVNEKDHKNENVDHDLPFTPLLSQNSTK
jgi:hypothetical protein